MIKHLQRFGVGILGTAALCGGLGVLWFVESIVIPAYPKTTWVVFAVILLYAFGGMIQAWRK